MTCRLPPRVLLSAVLAFLLASSVLFSFSVERLVLEARRLVSAMEARESVSELLVALLDAETGQRGFLITSQDRYLQPYLGAKNVIAVKLAALRHGLEGDGPTAALTDQLATLSGEKMEELGRIVTAHRSGGAAASFALVRQEHGLRLMDEVRRVAVELDLTIDARTQEYRTAFHAAKFSLIATAGGLAVTALALLAIVYRMRRRELGESRRREGESARLAALMSEHATRDALTGIHNRRNMSEIFAGAVARALEHDTPLSVAMLDIDHFKSLNDRHGHAVGDLVLAAVGRTLLAELKEGEFAFRYGGEEFALLLPGCSLERARDRMDVLRRRLAMLAAAAGDAGMPGITVSVGIAGLRRNGKRGEELLRAADAALFASKRAGRDRISLAARAAA